MSLQTWCELLASATGDGTAVTNTLTPTSLLTGNPGASDAKWNMPAGYMKAGKLLRIEAMGRITSPAAGTSVTLDVRIGAVIVATTQALLLNASAMTNQTWKLKWDLKCRQSGGGTNANFMHSAEWITRDIIGAPAAAAGGVSIMLAPETAPVVGTGFDSTTAATLDLFVTWTTAAATYSIQLHDYNLYSLN